jgi:hypothetical protein
MSQEQLNALRSKLIQSILQVIVQLVTGGLLPGDAGSQLTNWASSLPLIGPIITALTNGNIDPAAGLAGLQSFFNFAPGTTNLLSILESVGTDFISLVKSFIPGYTGTDQGIAQTDLGTIITNMLSLLGNPAQLLSGSFNPISAGENMLQTVLTDAGALATNTPLPAHLFSFLSPGNSDTNILPDPYFTNPAYFDGGNQWSWSALHPVSAPSYAGSGQLTIDALYEEMRTVPVPLSPSSGDVNAGASIRWVGVSGSGDCFNVAVNSYTGLDANGVAIEPPITDPNRVIVSITNPTTSSASWSGVDADGFVAIQGTYTPPAGTKYAVLVLESTPNALAGTVNFSAAILDVTARLDAGLLGNIENIPQLLGTSIQGFQGIPNLIATLGHLVDGLGTSVTSTTQSGLQFSDLFGQVQSMAESALSALGLANNHQAVLSNVSVMPLTAGLDPTAEATFDLQSLPHGSTLPTTTVATGGAIAGFINIQRAATKGFVEFIGSIAAASSGVYVNLYQIDPATGLRTLLWGSADIGSLIPSTTGYAKAPIPGGSQPALVASEQVMAEIVNKSGNTLTIASKTQPQPNRASGFLKNFGMVRTPTVTSPATVADSAFTYSGVTPWLSVGVLNVPAGYEPAVLKKFISPAGTSLPVGYAGLTAQAPWTTSYTLPSWFRPGIDYVDYVLLGSGGGGDSGVGGAGAPGGDTTIVVDGITYTATHGNPGNNGGGLTTSDNQGKGAGSITFNSNLYQAGANVADANYGSVPGGGGGGGVQPVGYTTYYGQGGYAGNWAHGTLQPTGSTISISLGYGGVGQHNFNAGSGADGAVWLLIYQNPSE